MFESNKRGKIKFSTLYKRAKQLSWFEGRTSVEVEKV